MKSYKEMKDRLVKVLEGGGNCSSDNKLVSEYKDYVESIIMEGMYSCNNVIRSYCSYAGCVNKEYALGGYVACVCVQDSNVVMRINPFNIILTCDNKEQVIFIIAHEVKHLLFSHIVKYKSLYREDVTALFLNLATDVEVNESLKAEILGKREGYINAKSSTSIPNSIFDYKSMASLLGMKLESVMGMCVWKKTSVYSVSDILYKSLNKKCIGTLGYSINEILYNCTIYGVSFVSELFNVVDGIKSPIFDIKGENKEEAIRFCKALCAYLRRKVLVTTVSCVGKGDPDRPENSDGSNSSSGVKQVSIEDSVLISGIDTVDEETLSDALKEVEDAASRVLENASAIRTAGTGSSEEKYKLQHKGMKTMVRWQNYLLRMSQLLSEDYKDTKRRINRRIPERIELSGREKDSIIQLVVAFDESGSISNQEYMYFVSELNYIIKKFRCELHLYEFSSEVDSYTYYKKEKVRRLKPESFSSRYNGGTSFQPVFDKIQANKNINKRDCILVIFTDGFGEMKVDFHGIKNRLWVIVGSNDSKSAYLSCKENKRNIYPIVGMPEEVV